MAAEPTKEILGMLRGRWVVSGQATVFGSPEYQRPISAPSLPFGRLMAVSLAHGAAAH